MKNLAWCLFLVIIACTPAREIYVVRHAEKAAATDTTVKMNANDPVLSEAGKVRAFVLRDELSGKHISHIYSTNTIRTISTAEPLSRRTGVIIEKYASRDSLADQIRIQKGNVLVVGHSNTIDDIVNRLTGKTDLTDLKDFEYDNMYLIRQRGKKMQLEKKKYGYPSNPE